ncbi:hypothetical protein EI94DRAFT_265120 [Lactarius quietus]|nr:hypothetical protein EI94DRAFT_265120 [Lactarius quietus]
MTSVQDIVRGALNKLDRVCCEWIEICCRNALSLYNEHLFPKCIFIHALSLRTLLCTVSSRAHPYTLSSLIVLLTTPCHVLSHFIASAPWIALSSPSLSYIAPHFPLYTQFRNRPFSGMWDRTRSERATRRGSSRIDERLSWELQMETLVGDPWRSAFDRPIEGKISCRAQKRGGSSLDAGL